MITVVTIVTIVTTVSSWLQYLETTRTFNGHSLVTHHINISIKIACLHRAHRNDLDNIVK